MKFLRAAYLRVCHVKDTGDDWALIEANLRVAMVFASASAIIAVAALVRALA